MKFLIGIIFSLNVVASTSGHISIDQRFFDNDGVENTNDRGFAVSTNLRSNMSWMGVDFSGNVLGRVDDQDPTRNIFILQEAMLRYKIGTWEIFGGAEKFNLGSLEVFKPADNLNARNFDSDVENTEKFGELTYGLKKNFSWGDVNLFGLPGREVHYIPGANSRLGVGIDVQEIEYIKNDNREKFGLIVNYFGDLGDFSLFYLNHLDKKLPIFGFRNYIPCGCSTDLDRITPVYYETKEYGATASMVFSDLIFKLEVVSRKYDSRVDILTINGLLERPDNHTDAAVGIEYTQNLESGMEIRYLAEYAKVFGVDENVARKRFVFQNDLYLGAHFTLNDPMDTKFNIGGVIDLSGKSEGLYFVSFDRRLDPNWRIKTGLRYIDAKSTGIYPQGLEIFEDDHQAYLNLSYYI